MPQVIPAAVQAVVGFLGKTLFTIGSLKVTVATVAKIALAAGTYAYSRNAAKKAARAFGTLDTSRSLTVREPAGSRTLVYGTMRVGGTLVFAHVSGTNKEYLHLVVAHAAHECDAISTCYLNDEEVPLDGSGNATGKYAGYVRWLKHLGADSQTVDTSLQTDVGSSVWSNDHRLRGICYSYVRLKHSPELFPSGIPNVSVLLRGKKVYDPRSATTAWSANAALCLRDYLLLSADRGGLGADSSEVDDAAVQTAANICDESVNLNPSGTEARYTVNGVVDTSAEPGAVIAQLAGAMAGICPYIGGVFKMKAGAHTASVWSIGEDDIRGGVRVATRDSLRAAFNGVKGVYAGVKNNYQPGDFPPVVNSTYTTEDGGVRIWRDLALNFTTSASMAQRLAKIELERSRQDIVVTLRTSLKPIEAHTGDVVDLTFARYGWSAKLFEVVECRFVVEEGDGGPVLALEWSLRETASGVWDWNNGEETTVDLAPNTTLVDPFTVPTPSAPTLSTSNFVQTDGTISPRLKVVITTPSDDKVTQGGFIEVEYKKTADGTWLVWNPSLRGNATEDYITDVQSGVGYDVRLRFRNVHGVRGSYSSTSSHTVGNDTTAPATPSGLTAVAGTGKTIALDWSDNTEDDLLGYKVYRHTSNSFAGATYLAFTAASYYVDATAAESTQYYYWVKAVDRSGNESAESSSANATTSTATNPTLGAPYFIADPAIDSPSGTNELVVQDASGVPCTIYSRPIGQTTWDTTSSNGSSTKRYLSVNTAKLHEAFVRASGYIDSGVVTASFNDC